MDKICAIVDVQGFMLHKEFIPKELSIYSPDLKTTVYFNPPQRELTYKEEFMVNYQTKNIHGLPFYNKGMFEPESLKVILKIWYLSLATEEKQMFACKNSQLHLILKECKIPVYDLKNAPKLKELSEIYKDGCRHQRCAVKKTLYLWRWLSSINKDSLENPSR